VELTIDLLHAEARAPDHVGVAAPGIREHTPTGHQSRSDSLSPESLACGQLAKKKSSLTPPVRVKKFGSVHCLFRSAARALRDAAMASIIKRNPFTTRVVMALASAML
jgi:hypothetical protein